MLGRFAIVNSSRRRSHSCFVLDPNHYPLMIKLRPCLDKVRLFHRGLGSLCWIEEGDFSAG